MMNIKTALQQIATVQQARKDKTADLTSWEGDFISGIAERAEKFGDSTHISIKQAAIIDKIFAERIKGKVEKKTGKSSGESAASPFPSAS